jgi:3-hydroxy-3-methylglutaryl CoA synthase
MKEESEERIVTKVAKALEKYSNDLPKSLPDVSSLVLHETISGMLDEVNVEFLLKNFDLDKEEAQKFLDNVYNWETFSDGAHGGIGLYYSNTSGFFYYFVESYNHTTNKRKMEVYRLEKVAIKTWMQKGYFNECFADASAVQLL